MARLRGAARGGAADGREGVLLPPGPPGAAARAHGPGAAGRANQDVPGAIQDPLQGRQRRAQGRDGNGRGVRADYPAAGPGSKQSAHGT